MSTCLIDSSPVKNNSSSTSENREPIQENQYYKEESGEVSSKTNSLQNDSKVNISAEL